MDKIKCIICGKEYSKMGINTHIWRNHTTEGKKHNPNNGYKNGRVSWNKGLTKEINESIKKTSEALSKKPSTFKGKHHTEEAKKKLSDARIKYLKENPDKVPYKLNHSSRQSYPEKLFEDELNKRNIFGWIQKYQIGLYEYDFAWPELKIDVEIDGATHNQEKVKKIDHNRDIFSKENGWKVIRFKARDIKLNINQCFNILEKYL
jgi:very-short-patch-repair endonuclease